MLQQTKHLKAEEAFTLQYEQKAKSWVLNFNIALIIICTKSVFKFQVENGNTILGQAFLTKSQTGRMMLNLASTSVSSKPPVTMPVKAQVVFWSAGRVVLMRAYVMPQEQTIFISRNVNPKCIN